MSSKKASLRLWLSRFGRAKRLERKGNAARLGVEQLETRDLFSVNSIVAENLLPGNPQSEWDVVGDGDTSIQGFATDMSVDQGQTVYFKINDTSSAPYHIDIYRMGYYQGDGARKVATIPSTQTLRQVQPAPIKDLTIGLIDAGNWAVSASWAVPSNATSGVYLAKVVREDTGGASHILFVVRDDDGQSDVLVQTADTTWQAYNVWGGYSLYAAPQAGTAANPNSLSRAAAVSYNRPFSLRSNPGGNGSYNSYFHSEYPMVRWLEANGYNVSYTSDVDTDRYGSELLEHKVFVSMGHDEYWSGQQRASVEAARDAGVNLAFLTGNEVYWKIRWQNSIDTSGAPYRTLVCYKESKDNARTDPLDISQGIWTGTWRDTRFSPPADGGRPENALTGSAYMNDRTSTELGLSLEVPAQYASMWFWRNTAVANLQPGQVAALGDRVVGYETNEDLDNGFRPAGLMTLSSTTFTSNSHVVVPWGTVTGTGSSTHQLTLYRAASGALVFGAGTVQWSWGLDGTHDNGNSTPDQSIRQATVNLFADMGVQPAALQPGLVAGTPSLDLTRPTSTISFPTASTTAQAGTPITITGTATDYGGGMVGGVEVSTDGGRTWRKATGTGNWTYTWMPNVTGPATILSRAVDDNGNVEIASGGVQLTVATTPTSTVGLVAAYSFNAGSGATVADSSSYHNDGSIANATWSTTGMFGGGALSFNGTSSWVTIPDANSLDLTTTMTLEAWVKPTAASNFGTVLFKETAGSLSYALYGVNGPAEPPAAYIRTGGGEQAVEGPTPLPLNTWTHLALTSDGTTLSLYVNGYVVATQAVPGSITTSNGVLRIGGNSIYGDYFQGLIDEVRIYNWALSQGQIATDMSTPIGGSVDVTPPTSTVTTGSGTVSGVTTLAATASDNVAIAGVQFLLNGQPLGAEDTSVPYSIPWNTQVLPNGTYSITARARDMAGNSTTSTAVNLTVANSADITLPTVSLKNLTTGTTVGGMVVLRANASDNIGVVGVQFKVNGINVGAEVTSAPYAIAWSTAGLTSGNYSVTAVARDAAGNVTTSSAIPVVVDTTAPSITAQTPAANATAVPTDSHPSVTFNESIQPATLSFVLKDAGGNALAAAVSYNDTTRTATLIPNAALTTSATYTVTVSGAKDLVGNTMPSSLNWSFTADSHLTGATIWADSVVPAVPAAQNDSSPIEVGVKFRSTIAGSIIGLRFYKGAGNTGTHVGHLWTAGGTLLGTATFTNETATGWQEVTFFSPVPIAANTTYVASYFAPNGRYAFTSGFFSSAGANSSPLRALADGEDGANGLFLYQSGGGFPTGTYQAANYWVDVVFSTNFQDTTAPTVATRTPAQGATGVPTGSTVTATFSEPVQANTISFVLRNAANAIIPATVSYNDATWTATLTPNSPLTASATYTVTVSGVSDAAGNAMAAASSWSFATTAPASGTSIWSDSVVPAVPAAQNDSSPIEVGVKFRSDSAGYITGLRFYKGAGNTGTHVGHLWTAGGTLLGTATFTNETATGWQEVTFSSPVPIAANTTYVASYFAPNGRYAFTSGFFSSAGVDTAPLHALANGVDGGNGLFTYASGGGFPTGTYQAANYWVDVVFSATAQDTTSPAVAAQTPANGATAVPTTSTVTLTFSEPVQAGSLSFVLKDAGNNTVPASVSYNAGTQTATLTPNAALAVNTTYTATVTATDLAGNAMPATSWSFTTPTPATAVSIWPSSATPSILNDSDTNPIEVGVRFFSEVNGYITGLRFYRGPNATGTHVGHLWTDSGTLLATATFTNETSSGWQQVTFSSPVAITANTLYVASYYAPSGRYSATPNYFATSGMVNGYLHAPPNGANGGNGLFGYINGGGFPTNTYNANNYWVDVLFSQTTTDTTPPTVATVSPGVGSLGALVTAPIQAAFSEAVNATTVTFQVHDSFNAPVTGNLDYDAATHTASFIPTSPLLPFMNYTVTVSGVKDLSGNTIAAPYTWTFKTQGVWTQTSVADFSTGSNDGTVVTNTSGGEVTLAPMLQEEFSDANLNTATWTIRSWASEGGGTETEALSNGVLTLGGAGLLSAQNHANTGVQGVISFGAAPYQHFGLVTSFDSAAGNHWALFSTYHTSDRLFARVNANGSTNDVDIGPLPFGFHTYRVQPTAGGFDFYVDGNLRATIAANFQSTVPMRAGVSNYTSTSGNLLQADRIWFESYSTTQTGTFTSTVFDAGQQVTWNSAHWTATVPSGTTVNIQVRAGNTASPDANWSEWVSVAIDLAILEQNNPLQGRYFQYRAILTTTNSNATPVLKDISFSYQ